ncbi:MAG TPA: 3-oxo-tetronate kinase [Blastocatellia bacterium]|nr:3-oxo-tetronate kinase [Blastocatellia bacterium]
MDRLVFAAVADDDTGASDLAGMLAEQGLSTLLVIDLPPAEQLIEWGRGYTAIVMAEGTRNLPPRVAHERTRDAIRLLQRLRPRVFAIKYCSTFDSTNEGNIGPSIDAALDELNEPFTIALPALPVNGRATYMGYHFVHRQLLSDSPLSHHPLTPMTNANLVDLLGRQTRRPVGLVPYAVVEAGAEQIKDEFDRLRREGIAIAIVDCLNEQHLEAVCQAAADLRLITGSSAFGMRLPAIWRERGWLPTETEAAFTLAGSSRDQGCLLVAGSCSVATREQNEWLASQGALVIRIDPRELLTDAVDRASLIAPAQRELAAGRPCLLTTSAAPEEVREVQAWAATRGLTVARLGEAIAYALADVAREVMEATSASGVIAAGGETSGALCRRLELGALHVGRNIEPGVPLCFSVGRRRLPVVLKSGNFGGRDFYGKALRAIECGASG